MSSSSSERCTLVTLGMFIIDEFLFLDAEGKPTGRTQEPEIGGGGTYCAVGARIWSPPSQIGMVIDRGHDFPPSFQQQLDTYGPLFYYRDHPRRQTTRAANIYTGEVRGCVPSFSLLLPSSHLPLCLLLRLVKVKADKEQVRISPSPNPHLAQRPGLHPPRPAQKAALHLRPYAGARNPRRAAAARLAAGADI